MGKEKRKRGWRGIRVRVHEGDRGKIGEQKWGRGVKKRREESGRRKSID